MHPWEPGRGHDPQDHGPLGKKWVAFWTVVAGVVALLTFFRLNPGPSVPPAPSATGEVTRPAHEPQGSPIPPAAPVETLYLVNMPPVKGGFYQQNTTASVGGQSLINSISATEGANPSLSEVDFEIPPGYRTFQASLGLNDNIVQDPATFHIYADDEAVLNPPVSVGKRNIKKVSVSVAGHKLLKLIVTPSTSVTDAVFGMARLIP
jgi:NPCBM/NEW2 domain